MNASVISGNSSRMSLRELKLGKNPADFDTTFAYFQDRFTTDPTGKYKISFREFNKIEYEIKAEAHKRAKENISSQDQQEILRLKKVESDHTEFKRET